MGEMVNHVQKFIPRHSGDRKIVVTFNSRELVDIVGSKPVPVRDWTRCRPELFQVKTLEPDFWIRKQTNVITNVDLKFYLTDLFLPLLYISLFIHFFPVKSVIVH